MSLNRGKQFENQFKIDWQKAFPQSICLRLPDQQSGYYGTSQNICDFICYNNGIIYFLECKSHKNNTFPISNLRQYPKMIPFQGKKGARVGILLWFIDHQKVYYIPIKTISKMIQDKLKSINIKTIDSYRVFEIPSQVKRVLLSSDYTKMLQLQDGD